MVTLWLALACDGGAEVVGSGTTPADSGPADSDPEESKCVSGNETDADCDGAGVADDCDDLDATRHPGNTEYCDAVDQDCDGDPLNGAACSPLQLGSLASRVVLRAWGENWHLTSDATGDSVAELVASVVPKVGDDIVGLYDLSIPLGGASLVGDDYRFAFLRDGTAAAFAGTLAVGDVDGDGQGDFGAVSYGMGFRGAWLEFGPLSIPGDAKYLGAADEFWGNGAEAYDPVTADFNGDGAADLVLNEMGEASPFTVFSVYYGGEFSAPDGDSRGRSVVGDDGMYLGAKLPDYDGDGQDDLVVEVDDLLVISGADLDGFDEANIVDLTSVTVTQPEYPSAHGYFNGDLLPLRDTDGDGRPTLGVLSPTAETDDGKGEIFFFDLPDRGVLTVEDARGSWIGQEAGAGDDYYFGSSSVLDFDGDAMDDVFVSWLVDGDQEGGACLLAGRWGLPASLGEFPPARRYCYGSESDQLVRDSDWRRVGLEPSPLDATGDGRADILYYWPDPDSDTDTIVGILPGFDVPWDDDSYW